MRIGSFGLQDMKLVLTGIEGSWFLNGLNVNLVQMGMIFLTDVKKPFSLMKTITFLCKSYFDEDRKLQ